MFARTKSTHGNRPASLIVTPYNLSMNHIKGEQNSDSGTNVAASSSKSNSRLGAISGDIMSMMSDKIEFYRQPPTPTSPQRGQLSRFAKLLSVDIDNRNYASRARTKIEE